jgi:small-conductance mechanosensitive channel
MTNPTPFVRFIEFGDSSLNFAVIFWSEDVFRVENIKSEIRIKYLNYLKKIKFINSIPATGSSTLTPKELTLANTFPFGKSYFVNS